MIWMAGKRRPRATLGLDIGTGSVKASLIEHSSGRPCLLAAGEAACENGRWQDGIARALEGLVEHARRMDTLVVAAVRGRDVVVKRIEIEDAGERDLKDVLPWEAEQHIPFEMDDVVIDAQVLERDVKTGTMDVLIVAARRRVIQYRLELAQTTGFPVAAIDVEALALRNALVYSRPGAVRGISALIDIGRSESEIVVLASGVPVLARCVAVGTDDIRIGPDEAEAPGSDLKGRIARLLEAAGRAVRFVREEDLADGIGAVFLCGGGAAAPGLVRAMGEGLGIQTQVATPLANLDMKGDALDGIRTTGPEMGARLMATIGLGLRSFR